MKEQPPVLPAAMRREAEVGSGMKLKLKLGGNVVGGGPGSPGDDDAEANEMDEDDYDDVFDEWSSPEAQPYATPEKLVLPLRLGGSSGGAGGTTSTPISSRVLDPSAVFASGPAEKRGGPSKDEIHISADLRQQRAPQSSREGSGGAPGSGAGTPISEGGLRAGAGHQQSPFNGARGGLPIHAHGAVPPPSRPPLPHAASSLLPSSTSPSTTAATASPSVGVGHGLVSAGPTPNQYPRGPMPTVKPRERVLSKVVSHDTQPRTFCCPLLLFSLSFLPLLVVF
jgi:hypothetical protein